LINYFTVTRAANIRLTDADVVVKLLTWIKMLQFKSIMVDLVSLFSISVCEFVCSFCECISFFGTHNPLYSCTKICTSIKLRDTRTCGNVYRKNEYAKIWMCSTPEHTPLLLWNIHLMQN